ncbi:pentatricopeptide repeat-containing protein-like [Dorcoceras hygrometricum]|uniref:Pentatricopeptide repeat-containing protein-like n=1 Tax=Dorcoceras hygrometricum TaxID=472368 RepID=A0A2Z7DFD3_9LAMI|nr:pentatricopeptide repeat-containing protein-like [Dorcoceras hygrometricum]
MTSALLIGRNQESAVDKKCKSWISDDDVSSDVITISSYRELQPVDKESSRKLQCTQSQATVSCISSRRKTRRRKNQLLVAILAFCGILRNQSTGARIQTLAREFQQFLREYRSVVELERKSAATQIPQRRNFSSDANSAATIQQRRNFSSDANSAATHTSSAPRNFIIQISRNPDFCSRTSTVAYRSDFTIITVDLGGFMAN